MTLYRLLDFTIPFPSVLRPPLTEISMAVKELTGVYFHPSTWLDLAMLVVLNLTLFCVIAARK